MRAIPLFNVSDHRRKISGFDATDGNVMLPTKETPDFSRRVVMVDMQSSFASHGAPANSASPSLCFEHRFVIFDGDAVGASQFVGSASKFFLSRSLVASNRSLTALSFAPFSHVCGYLCPAGGGRYNLSRGAKSLHVGFSFFNLFWAAVAAVSLTVNPVLRVLFGGHEKWLSRLSPSRQYGYAVRST